MNPLIKKLWVITIVCCLLPLVLLFIDVLFDDLGANPIRTLHFRLGDWSLRFLYLTLAITPIQVITEWRGLANYRQLFGLFAFFYATLHVLVYLLVDHALAWPIIGTDIFESTYLWFGLLAYLIVFLLALTSSKWAKKQMGKNWKKLHRLIYIAAVAAIIHYFMQLKANLAEPLLYSIIVAVLLSFRVLVWLKVTIKRFRR